MINNINKIFRFPVINQIQKSIFNPCRVGYINAHFLWMLNPFGIPLLQINVPKNPEGIQLQ